MRGDWTGGWGPGHFSGLGSVVLLQLSAGHMGVHFIITYLTRGILMKDSHIVWHFPNGNECPMLCMGTVLSLYMH